MSVLALHLRVWAYCISDLLRLDFVYVFEHDLALWYSYDSWCQL